jgi:hypothetical protein
MLEAEIAFIGATTSEHGFMRGRRPVWRRAVHRRLNDGKFTTGIDRLQIGCPIVKLTGQTTPITQGPSASASDRNRGSAAGRVKFSFNSRTGKSTGIKSDPITPLMLQKSLI